MAIKGLATAKHTINSRKLESSDRVAYRNHSSDQNKNLTIVESRWKLKEANKTSSLYAKITMRLIDGMRND